MAFAQLPYQSGGFVQLTPAYQSAVFTLPVQYPVPHATPVQSILTPAFAPVAFPTSPSASPSVVPIATPLSELQPVKTAKKGKVDGEKKPMAEIKDLVAASLAPPEDMQKWAGHTFATSGFEKKNVLRASMSTPVSGLAGAIAKRLRTHDYVSIESMGAESVAKTLRSLALAKHFIRSENRDFVMQLESICAPSPEDEGDDVADYSTFDHPGLRFLVRSWHFGTPPPAPAITNVIQITSDMVVAKAAGATAKTMRGPGLETGCMGLLPSSDSASINIAAKAVVLTRAMLSRSGLDVFCRPRFLKEEDMRSLKPELFLELYLVHTKPFYLSRQPASSIPNKGLES